MMDIPSALNIVRRRRVVVLLTLLAGLAGVFLLFRYIPRTYGAASHVFIVNETSGRDPSVTSIDLPSLATSTAVLEKVLDDLKLPISLIEIKKNVKARVNARSSIMEISYRDASAERAVAVSNAVADELRRYYEEISTVRADATIRKLDVEIQSEQNRLRDSNRQLALVARDRPYLISDKALDTVTSRIDDLEAQRELARAALAGDRSQAKAAGDDVATISKAARHEVLQNDPLHRALSEGLAKDAAQLAFDRAAFTARYPGLPSLQEKVDAENASIRAEEQRALTAPNAYSPSQATSIMQAHRAAAIIAGDRARIAALDRLIRDERARLNEIPATSTALARLRLQRDAAQANYLALSARRTSAVANRAEALSLGSVVVVDRAVRADAAVVGLGRTPLAAMTAAFVLLLAVGNAFLIEMLDPRLWRAAQIEHLYESPLIASLGSEH